MFSYLKFGHCKFNDKCKSLYAKDECEIPSCDINSCNLGQCKIFKEYTGCKFSDYRLFKPSLNSNDVTSDKNSEMLEKIESIAKTVQDKDKVIKVLVEKVRMFEEKIFRTQ